MRKINRILLLLLLLAAIFPFTFPWKDGKPLLNWSDITKPEIPEITLPEMPELADLTKSDNKEEIRAPHQPVTLYRWQSDDGGIQFSNELPPQGVSYEVVEVNPDANIVQAITPETGQKPATEEEASGISLPSPLTVSPQEATQLLEDARKIRDMSEERLRQHEAIMQ